MPPVSTGPVIATSGRSKDYGRGGAVWARPRGPARGGVRLPGSERRGQVDDDAPTAESDQADLSTALVLGLDTISESLEILRRVGFLPGDLAMYPKLTGRAMLDYLSAPGWG